MLKEQVTLMKELVGKIAGKNTEPIVDLISGGKPVNEFKIAERLKLTINQTRNILYKLTNQNIVSFVRKKDTKKGWYIYSWSINYQRSLEKLSEIKKKEVFNYGHLLESRQNRRFYICPSECMETNEENAMLHDFKCHECGQLLQLKSFSAEIEELKAKIAKAKEEIEVIKLELDKINAERERKEVRDLEKKRIERLKKRRAKAKALKRLKKKMAKPLKKKIKARGKNKKKAKKSKKVKKAKKPRKKSRR